MSDLGLSLPQPIRYFETPDVHDTKFDRFGQGLSASLVSRGTWLRSLRLRPILHATRRYETQYAEMSDAQLRAEVDNIRRILRLSVRDYTFPLADCGQAFALVREASERVLGMRHYDVQMLGSWAMLKGQVAEMRTGEGKTLCATLAASTAALAGYRVHVMTVNEYLATRDCAEMRPLYEFLGLTVGVLEENQEPPERQAAHACNIVHGTNTDFAFDYLRDRSELRKRPGNLRRKVETLTHDPFLDQLRLRGLHFAVIDEADSVLIDEARTPLIISGQISEEGGIDEGLFRKAMDVALGMEEGKDFEIPRHIKKIDITDAGFEKLDDLGEEDDTAFGIPVIREHTVMQALNALHIFQLGDAYIIKEGEVLIVDENTGRTMEDRKWSDGLHQMVELKEGLDMTEPRETLSRITYQRFFRRYGQLSGMTGTARDAAWELWSVYRLAVTKIPTNKPDARVFVSDRVYRTEDAKWVAITKRTIELHKAGKPVLLGTRSVSASEEASRRLSEAGVPHEVLSAAQDANEADIIALAGQRGAVMVATNMAGRGTDIKLSDKVKELGGLHVILTERHDSRRVDRQLEGRCGRQGEKGRVEAYLSLEDDLMQGRAAAGLRRTANLVSRVLGARSAGIFIRMRQRMVEAQHAQTRRDLLDADRNLGYRLAVAGETE